MKRMDSWTIFCAIPAALLFLSPCASQEPARKSTSAHSQIESVLKMQQEAWNRGDIEAFLQGYWHSPELTFSGSSGISRGWDGVLKRYQETYPNRAAMGQLTFSNLEFRRLGPAAYLVLGQWHLSRESGATGGLFTLIFERFPGSWRIIHDHTSLVPPKILGMVNKP
jgi:ketosteroid isomerase-like protein